MVDYSKVLTDMVKAIVDSPDAVSVTRTEENGEQLLELNVAPDDMGKVIGKHGRIAHSLRLVIKAAAAEENAKVAVKIR